MLCLPKAWWVSICHLYPCPSHKSWSMLCIWFNSRMILIGFSKLHENQYVRCWGNLPPGWFWLENKVADGQWLGREIETGLWGFSDKGPREEEGYSSHSGKGVADTWEVQDRGQQTCKNRPDDHGLGKLLVWVWGNQDRI